MNPYSTGHQTLRHILENEVLVRLGSLDFDRLHFYGSGYAAEANKQLLASLLEAARPGKPFFIHTDLLGAARGLLGKNSGAVAILGTGSNFGFYDGTQITIQMDSLGWILGDEGSGVDIGKAMIINWLRGHFPDPVRDDLARFCTIGRDEILQQVYQNPGSRTFLASFAPFAAKQLGEPTVRQAVRKCFMAFIQVFQTWNPAGDVQLVNFTGSIAWNFREMLKECMTEKGLETGNIVPSPMEGLIHFHATG